MKYSTALLLAASGFALAQDMNSMLSMLPKCALSCFTEAAGSTGCQLTDLTCQCTTGREAAQKALLPCVCKGCQPDDVQKALEAGESICKSAMSAANQPYQSLPMPQGDVCQALAGGAQAGAAASQTAPAAGPAASQSAPAASAGPVESQTAPAAPPAYSAPSGVGAAPVPYGNNSTASAGHAKPTGGNTPPASGTGSGAAGNSSVVPSPGAASTMGFSGAVVGLAALAALAL